MNNEHHYTTLCRNDCPAVVAAFLERMVEMGIIGQVELARCGADPGQWTVDGLLHDNGFESQPWHMDEETESIVNRGSGRSWHIKELLYPRDVFPASDTPDYQSENYDDPDGFHVIRLFNPGWSKPAILLWMIDNNLSVMDTPTVIGDGRDCSGAALARIEYYTNTIGHTMVTYRVVIDV